jgi:hypothetical protein
MDEKYIKDLEKANIELCKKVAKYEEKLNYFTSHQTLVLPFLDNSKLDADMLIFIYTFYILEKYVKEEINSNFKKEKQKILDIIEETKKNYDILIKSMSDDKNTKLSDILTENVKRDVEIEFFTEKLNELETLKKLYRWWIKIKKDNKFLYESNHVINQKLHEVLKIRSTLWY